MHVSLDSWIVFANQNMNIIPGLNLGMTKTEGPRKTDDIGVKSCLAGSILFFPNSTYSVSEYISM